MANPITPAGFRDLGAVEEAQRQDAERNQRAANEHAQRTGQTPRHYEPPNPLVPINGYADQRDIANDGDSYDVNNINNGLARSLSELFTVGTSQDDLGSSAAGEYVENNPSQLITNAARNRARNQRRRQGEVNEQGEVQAMLNFREEKQLKREKEQLTKALEERRGQVKDALSDLDL
jgi:hypothetical protein